MVAPEDIDVAGHVHVNAGRLWAGGVATAVVAALAVLAGVLITRGVLGIPVLAPKTANNFGNSATAVYALLAAGAALLATALLHMLLLGTPRPSSSVDVRAADGQPIWLSTDGEVATAESGFVHGKHPHALVVYRKADG